jgi:hypothetical protein
MSANSLQAGIDEPHIELGGIERPADPAEVVVVLVRRVGEDLQEIFVSPGASAVLRRAGVRSVEAHRELQADRDPPQRRHGHLVDLGATEVVLVGEALATPQRTDEGHRRLVELSFGVLVEPQAIPLVADLEGMQVTVLPAHRCLEDPVDLREPHTPRYQQSAPHPRLHLAQLDHTRQHRLLRSSTRPPARGRYLVTAIGIASKPLRNSPRRRCTPAYSTS